MSRYTKEDIMRIVEEEDVAFIRLGFADIFGQQKNIAVTSSQLDRVLNNEITFDGCALEGLINNEDDLFLYPDLQTFNIYPWRPQSGKVARMFCNVYTRDQKPYEGDPRGVLQRVVAGAQQENLNIVVNPELEFFLFDLDEQGKATNHTGEEAGYFDVAPADQGENVRRDIILNLEEMNFDITSSYHEKAPAQHEIHFSSEPAVRCADMIMTFRMAAKTIAKRHGLYASFLPKPLEGEYGSGLHMNFMFLDALGKNLLYDPEDPMQLSEMGYSFISGILEHAKGMTLLTNPIVNSYKRLVPGYDAPVNIGWAGTCGSRSVLIRIPSIRGSRTRIELRSPDAACNPYLVMAVAIAAGMDGIKRGLKAVPELTEDKIIRDRDPLTTNTDQLIPQTMGDAILAFAQDDFIRGVLGDGIYEKYLTAKKREWEAFRTRITQWEIDEYLNRY